MLRPLRDTTYADAESHGSHLISTLPENEGYAQMLSRAKDLGVEVDCCIRHTYQDDVLSYPHKACEGRLPTGYAMELWFDIVKDGRILSAASDGMQMSTSATAVYHRSGLFSQKACLLELEEVLAASPVVETLEEFLDRVEEGDAIPSPFLRDGFYSPEPRAEAEMLVGIDQVGEGTYVELAEGRVTAEGGESSVYFSAEAFLPFALLFSALPEGGLTVGENVTLTAEQMLSMAELLEELPHSVKRCRDFADLLVDMGVGAIAPPPTAEACLNYMVYRTPRVFLGNAAQLSQHLRTLLSGEQVLTILY